MNDILISVCVAIAVGPAAPGHVRVPVRGAGRVRDGGGALQEGGQAARRAPHAAPPGRARPRRAAALRRAAAREYKLQKVIAPRVSAMN